MTERLTDIVEAIVGRWKQNGVRSLAANSALDLRTFTETHGVVLPDAFASYLLATGGMPDGESDDHGIRFWPLSEITPLATHLNLKDDEAAGHAFVFADYSVWAHAYAIRLSTKDDVENGTVFLVGSAEMILIAATFESFIKMYLYEPRSIFPRPSSSTVR
jgi:hypothetical protein